MPQKIIFYPIGNAETCYLELNCGSKILFDYAAMYNGSDQDKRYDIKKDLSEIGYFDIVMFSHAHDDHTKGASDFFYLEHAKKYQSGKRAKIGELWISSAFILDTDLENQSDAKIIREEARYRLKKHQGIKVFAEPDSMTEWLSAHDINYNDVSDLIIHAGTTINLPYPLKNEMRAFIHAPFSEDSEDIQNKNDPSIILQLGLLNNTNSGIRQTNILITGDTPYKVLDKIVDISKKHSNEAYLSWDIYDIPHHCSYTGLNEKPNDNDELIPSPNVQWLLHQSSVNAYMVASCDKVTAKTSPPHLIAKKAYEKYTKSDVSLLVTMEHTCNEDAPTPIIFEIDSNGVTLKQNRIQDIYLKKSAPRAGD